MKELHEWGDGLARRVNSLKTRPSLEILRPFVHNFVVAKIKFFKNAKNPSEAHWSDAGVRDHYIVSYAGSTAATVCAVAVLEAQLCSKYIFDNNLTALNVVAFAEKEMSEQKKSLPIEYARLLAFEGVLLRYGFLPL